MRRNTFLLSTAIVAVCYLYTGSAYMSQFYRLLDFYDAGTADIITTGGNYLLQAAGMALYGLGLWKRPRFFGRRIVFAALLATGAVFMAVSQLSHAALTVVLSGFIFELHIGVYFGFYLALFARNVPKAHAGLCFGAAYALGSVGTYLFSLLDGGAFLVSESVTSVYLVLAGVTAALVLLAEDIAVAEDGAPTSGAPRVGWLSGVIVLMMVISVAGSGISYAIPQAPDVNWNLIRAFYALGLILAGWITDRSRLVGEICAAASLAYPLVTMALIGEGVAGTAALAASYAVRGFLTVYYIIVCTDLGAEENALLPLSALGLFLARVTEALMTILLTRWQIPAVVQLITSAALFIPLLILFVLMETKRYAPQPVSQEQRLALFGEAHGLTARESEVLRYLAEGLSDDEIGESCHISRSTVRFHVSNLLKKTGSASRLEVVRLLKKT